MRNVSKKFKEAMETRRDFYAVGEITFANGTKKTLDKKDFSLSGNSVIDSAGSTSFPLGLLIPKQIKISLMNGDDRWSEYDFYGARIYLQTKFDLDDGTTESLNIGTFTVIAPESYGTTVEVTAMDDSYKTDKPYDTQYDYPMTVAVALRDCCSTCDILLGTSSFPNSDYIIPSKPENITHRQFIGLCAMIAGGNARFDEMNRLEIIGYDFSEFEKSGLDGGIFDAGTPLYESGDSADGGTFNPWTTGDVVDGGTFGDRDNIHVLYQYKSGIVVDVDDVVITGLQMESEDEDGNRTPHLFGKEGYVLSLENQLANGKEDEVLSRIGEKIVGISFRPFSGDHIALPTAEFMDLACVIDRKNNVYNTVLTDVTFNYFGFTNLKCAADSPIRNSSVQLGNEVKAIVEARKMVAKERTEREKAVEYLQQALATGKGMYPSEEVLPDGSTVYYLHDKPTREESQAIIKLTSEGIGISQDGGDSYPWGITFTGTAILEKIYSVGIDADYITTGAFEIRKDGKIMVLMDKDTGEVTFSPEINVDGETLGTKFSIVDNAITAEVSRAKGVESSLSSRLTIAENSISSKVSRSDVASMIEQSAGNISFSVKDGKLGSSASITLSVNGKETTESIDLSGVREAFKNDTSAITISGGTVTFNSNTFVVNSTNFKVTSSGTITATKGTIGGFTIDDHRIYAADITWGSAVFQKPTETNRWILGIGGSSNSSYGDCPFRVEKDGSLYAKKFYGDGVYISDDRISFDGEAAILANGGTLTLYAKKMVVQWPVSDGVESFEECYTGTKNGITFRNGLCIKT